MFLCLLGVLKPMLTPEGFEDIECFDDVLPEINIEINNYGYSQIDSMALE
ncbi:MAG: hypothetical protein AWU59_2599 [Methanolobus sp. T82-4]|jgi:hypothetical protein|nr:MAG: hypothetical protein AWU59_2599 [Methanolobus sp. T82-4]